MSPDSTSSSTRRRFLCHTSVVALVGFAGCSRLERAIGSRTGPHRQFRDAPVDGSQSDPWPTTAANSRRRSYLPDGTGPDRESRFAAIADVGDVTEIQPLITADHAYVPTSADGKDGSSGVQAVPLSVDTRWQVSGEMNPLAGGMAVVGNAVVVPVGPGVVAVDARTGATCWRYRTGSDPCIVDSTVYTADHGIRALDARTGVERWYSDDVRVGYVSADRDIICGTGLPDRSNEPGIAAWNPDGSLRWSATPGGGRSYPVLDEKRVYVAGDDGTLTALDRQSGQIVWQFDLGNESDVTPAVDGRHVYAVQRNGNRLYGLDKETGGRRWTYEYGDGYGFTPVVVNQTVYGVAAGSSGATFALDVTDGTERWRQRVRAPPAASPVVGDGGLWFPSRGRSDDDGSSTSSGLYALR